MKVKFIAKCPYISVKELIIKIADKYAEVQ